MGERNGHWTDDEAAEFLRLPGLFRRWEIVRIVEAGPEFCFEEAGATDGGEPLFAVFRRERPEGTGVDG